MGHVSVECKCISHGNSNAYQSSSANLPIFFRTSLSLPSLWHLTAVSKGFRWRLQWPASHYPLDCCNGDGMFLSCTSTVTAIISLRETVMQLTRRSSLQDVMGKMLEIGLIHLYKLHILCVTLYGINKDKHK